jgi:hypothetical protein
MSADIEVNVLVGLLASKDCQDSQGGVNRKIFSIGEQVSLIFVESG